MTSLVEETSILTSGLTAGRAGPGGCLLVGTIHFNIGTFRFARGQAQFLLKNAEIQLRVSGCKLREPAYIQKFSEEFEGKATTEIKSTAKQSSKASAGAGAALTKGKPSAAAHGKLEVASEELDAADHTAKFTESAAGERIVFSYSREGGRWILSGRDLRVGGRSVVGLLGDHLQRGAGAKGLLATLQAKQCPWAVSLWLSFRPQDVFWWAFDGKNSRLAAVLEMLTQSDRPEAFLTRVAMAKWLSKRVREEPFFEHDFHEASV